MAKRIFRREDEGRTELLGQAELFVQKGKGSDTYYNAWLHDPEIEYCPRCGSDAVKTQDLFSKTYMDLVSDGEKKKVIQLEYDSDLEHWSGVPLDDVLAVFDQRVYNNGGNE